MIYIVIVANLKPYGLSKRSYGDWAAFVGSNKTEVIQRAQLARKAWKSAGDYKLYLGTLSHQEAKGGWEEIEPLQEQPKPTYMQ